MTPRTLLERLAKDREIERNDVAFKASRSGTSPLLSGGDVDAQWQMAESVGDEAACGSAMTPDQNVVNEFAEAVGISYADDEELRCGEKEQTRDAHRWELDPASSDDYEERTHAHRVALRWRHFLQH